MVVAQTDREGLLFGRVVERDRPRLGLAVVVSGQCLDDDRAVRDRVEHASASLWCAVDTDEMVGAVAGAVARGQGVWHVRSFELGDALASRMSWVDHAAPGPCPMPARQRRSGGPARSAADGPRRWWSSLARGVVQLSARAPLRGDRCPFVQRRQAGLRYGAAGVSWPTARV